LRRLRSVVFGASCLVLLCRVPAAALAAPAALLVVPPVVGGVGLFYAFARWSRRGFSTTGSIQLTSTAGAVMAETFVALPFLVITVEAALRSMDRRYEDAGTRLGRPSDGVQA
jgi:molybdate transport system permease protein